ncbi:oxidoreductase with NAD(P)-binding Rossmann-fold domain, 3-hydroxyisobutyrate dehydrogenase [Escherichia coli]|uniref:Oxidoreductase with NAD(P)-binding Rossmann-fold domain, 3-hydroxyisobutyrate dehydrogenase n=1 Tax=Escherichia coli TaxID=562 RepID=A0A377DE70_ECOLX|nr:oxidoreductase with NAD(P)-binding Rossmann-fold domain, 3-hydroxyisobutyrate dehydrogenase [Escherichia coli]
MATIAFLGLGQMGSPMANNLLQKGHSLQVFDVNAQAVDVLVTQGPLRHKPQRKQQQALNLSSLCFPMVTLFDRFCWGKKASVRLFHLTRY